MEGSKPLPGKAGGSLSHLNFVYFEPQNQRKANRRTAEHRTAEFRGMVRFIQSFA
jgi:hypothetical protein